MNGNVSYELKMELESTQPSFLSMSPMCEASMLFKGMLLNRILNNERYLEIIK